MKKLLMAILAVMLVITPALAEGLIDTLKKIPETNQAVIYSFDDNESDYAATVTLLKLLDKKIDIDLGYTPRQEVIAVASIDLVRLSKWVEIPILEWIVLEPGIYAGIKRVGVSSGQNEFDWGLICKLLEVKF